MSMTIYGYNTDTDNQHLTKNLLNETVLTGSPRGEIGVENPIILIEGNITGLNYFYIPDLNRYYYVTGRNIIRDGLTEVSFHVDVLMSFVDGIRQLSIALTKTNKQATEAEGAFPKGVSWDSTGCTLPCKQQTYTNVIKIAELPIRPYFYLVTIG